MKHCVAICIVFTLAFCVGNAQAGMGVAGKVGTQGIGVEVTQSMIPTVNVRGGAYLFSHSFDVTKSDIKYNFKLKLKSFAVLMDVHPFPLVGYRLSGGVVLNGNKVDMVGDPQSSYQIGDQTYTGDQVGQLNGHMTFRKAAPYVGMGWGNAAKRRIGFSLDLGVVFQGSPAVSLTASGPIASDPNFQTQLKSEEQDIQDNVNVFKYYPVVSLGLSFKLSPM